jgi:hypothetical protein
MEAISVQKERIMRRWPIGAVGCLFVLATLSPCRGAEDKDELLRKIETLERQLKELKEEQLATSEKESHCMKAFGREKFCRCVAENLPREVSFEQYVHTVVTSKEGLGYDGLPPERRKSVDQTMAAREKCVEKEKGGFLW